MLLTFYLLECFNFADIAFVLDASGSVRSNNFDKMKDFLKTMVDQLNVDIEQSNVAMVTFSDVAEVQFHLNHHESRPEIKDAIDKVKYARGTTNTADALRVLRTEVFTRQNGDRPDLKNIGIILTDGGSNDFKETLEESLMAREAGITVVSISVGDWINKIELNEMASDPDSLNVFNIETFDAIRRIKDDLKAILCDCE